VRQFAVIGIGEIGDSDAANLVAPLVRDPANTVRKAAAGAMQKVGAFAHIDGLLNSLNPTVEPDPSVRQAVWEAIKTLAERGTPKALVDIAGRFMRGGPLPDPERRREILLMIEQKYEQQRPASADEAAQREEQLAITRQNLGETLLEMRGDSARQREQAAAAADYFRKARVHWESVRAAENVLLWAVQQEMRALLAAQKYKETIDLADAQLRRDPRLGDDMGRLLDAEVRRLRERKDYKPALALLDEAERVGPALRSYAELFKKVREDILRDQKDGGMLWPLRPMRLAGAQPRWMIIDG
jgi:tetratricopeptide (TPR) repeat protein